jgi:2-amino-4-hydroxy-6-hydroxymethyldihydropteridine diphosphokinase
VSTEAPIDAFIGLGSNFDGPAAQIRRAVEKLAGLTDTRFVAVSSMYRSAPFGPVEQPDFLNAAAHVQTGLDATELLRALLALEQEQGRVRGQRWGPRSIDLDLLVYGDLECDTDELTVPHPGIAARNFVLLPLQEIAPELVIPGLGRVASMAVNMDEPRISRID